MAKLIGTGLMVLNQANVTKAESLSASPEGSGQIDLALCCGYWT